MLRWIICLFLIMPLPVLAEDTVPKSASEISLSFVPVVKDTAPAVVNIYAQKVVNVRTSPFLNDPFFRRFFDDFGAPRQQVENSLGSGVILSEDGIVVSNYHVVGEATDIRVSLKDMREFSAKVILADEESDLAILKLEEAKDMPALELRDSDNVEVGELVLAIGNPFGVGQTVSSGIVSGLARSGLATGNARGYFIQTDAPINPGNSGGALVDIEGRLIGINTAILSRSGGSNGIGFAIPSKLVAQFVKQAREGREAFARPWAGLTGQPVTADMAEGLGLGRPGGMIVSDVHPQSPFYNKIQSGDVVTVVNGQPVNTPAEMIFRMSVEGLGGKVDIEFIRDGTTDVTEIDLISAPDEPARDQRTTNDGSVIPGMTLSRINPSVMAEYDLPLSATGVLIEDPGRIGARAGLRAGDILLAVNGDAVEDTKAAEAALRAGGRRLQLDVLRDGQKVSMRFRL